MDYASISAFRNRMGDYLARIHKTAVVLENRGKPTAVVLSYEEYERLQEAEDAWWGERARMALGSGVVGQEETLQHIQNKLNASP